MGVSSLNPCFLPTRSNIRMLQESLSDMVTMAPSLIDLVLSGMTKSGSMFKRYPRPRQVLQAPKGLLKENILGDSSSSEKPQVEQAIASLNTISFTVVRLFFSCCASPSTKTTVPFEKLNAV